MRYGVSFMSSKSDYCVPYLLFCCLQYHVQLLFLDRSIYVLGEGIVWHIQYKFCGWEGAGWAETRNVVTTVGGSWGILVFNPSTPGQNGCHFADNIFKCIFVNEKFCIPIQISLKFVPKDPIDNNLGTGLDNGLAPNRLQAIIWTTNTDPVHWCIYAALGGDELTHCSQVRKSTGSEVKWAECSLIIGTGYGVEVFCLILNSSVGL